MGEYLCSIYTADTTLGRLLGLRSLQSNKACKWTVETAAKSDGGPMHPATNVAGIERPLSSSSSCKRSHGGIKPSPSPSPS